MSVLQQIKADIDRLFGNSSVPISETKSDLEDIKEHIEMLLETLPDEDD